MKESEIQTKIMNMLKKHPHVVFATVTTTGRVKYKGYWITLGFIGLADIIGQMRDGRTLAIEVKKPGEKPTDEQLDFLDMVQRNGGISGWCDSVEGAMEVINGAKA